MGFDLGTVANIAGNLIGAGSSLAGGMINATTSKKIAREQMKLQKEFAQNGIQWRVEDAKKAGLHPLYAIGASGATYTPVSQDSSAMGNAVADAGAYLGKAVNQAIDKDTQKQLELENVAWVREQRDMARRKELSDIMHSELVNRNLVLRNEEQSMLNSQLAAGVSGNPSRPSVTGLSGVQGIYDIGGAYSNNPAVRSHLGKVRANSASAAVGVPLASAYTQPVVSGSTGYSHSDPVTGRRMVEILSSEARSGSADGMDVIGFNIPNIGYQWRNYLKPFLRQATHDIFGIGSGHSVRPKVINGTLHVYSPYDFMYIDTGIPVR